MLLNMIKPNLSADEIWQQYYCPLQKDICKIKTLLDNKAGILESRGISSTNREEIRKLFDEIKDIIKCYES